MSGADAVERNKAVIRRLPALLEALDAGALDVPRIAALFTEDFRLHENKHPHWPQGHSGAVRLLVQMKALMPDIRISIEDMVAGRRQGVRALALRGHTDRHLRRLQGRRLALRGGRLRHLPPARRAHCRGLGHRRPPSRRPPVAKRLSRNSDRSYQKR
jgi:hypothetical protein